MILQDLTLKIIFNEIRDRIHECVEMLRDLSDERKYYDDIYAKKFKIEYLKHIKDEIVSITEHLKELENEEVWMLELPK